MAESKTAKTYTADEADSPAYFQSGESWTCGADLISVADWFVAGTAAGFSAAAFIFCITGGRKP